MQNAFVRWVVAGTFVFSVIPEPCRADSPRPGVLSQEGGTASSLFVPPESAGAHCALETIATGGRDGGPCARLSSENFARFGLGLRQHLDVAPGDRCRVTFWIKNDGATIKPASAGIITRVPLSNGSRESEGSWAIFIGVDGKASAQSPADGLNFSGLKGDIPSDWTKVESVVEVPKSAVGTTQIGGIAVFGWETKGAFLLQGLSLEKVPPETPLSLTIDPVSNPGAKTTHAIGPVASDADALAELNVDAPGMEDVKQAVKSGDLAAVESAYLQYRRTKCPAKYFVMPADKPQKPVEADDVGGDEVAKYFIRNMYGFSPSSADMSKGDEIDWKKNPVAKSDPGFTNEWTWCVISRTQYWRTLADAYWKTSDSKYAQAWVHQITDFIRDNRSDDPKGPSLWRTLDASERMYNSWPYAYAHFIDDPAFTPEAQWAYLRSVLDHAALLKAGLDKPGRTGNWVASECYGLYAIGVLFPELKDAAKWREYTTARMLKELDLAVPPDGFEAELTPNYHYFTLSSYTGPVQLAQLNGLSLPDKVHEKIVAMYRAPVIVMDQRGVVQATNDSGEINVVTVARRDHPIWGSDPTLDWAISGKTRGTPLPTSTMLPYAGFYAMRGGWDLKDFFLFFRSGPAGIGHQHDDDLSIALRDFGHTLLFTQGVYPYDQSTWRMFDLGTSAYSSIIIDGNGQKRGANKPPVLDPVPNPWVTTPLFDFVSGTYDRGYQEVDYNPAGYAPTKHVGQVDFSVKHTRRIVFLKPYYALVMDTVDGTGKHTYDSLYYMDSPHASLDAKTQATFSANPGNAQLAIYPLDVDGLTIDIVQGQKQPMMGWYANRQEAVPTVRFHKEGAAPARFATFLYPFWGDGPKSAPKFSSENLTAGEGAAGNVWAEAIHSPMEDATIALTLDNNASAIKLSGPTGDLQANAAGIIRRVAAGKSALVGGWKISSYADPAMALTAATPADLCWEEEPGGMLVENEGEQSCDLRVTIPFAAEVKLSPHVWTEITKSGAAASNPPAFFPAQIVKSTDKPYVDYLKSQPTGVASLTTSPIRISSTELILPRRVELHPKQGVDHLVASAWETAGTKLVAEVSIPEAGWYRMKVRYCSADTPERTLLINDVCPFAEASEYPLPSTMGPPPSDGWSNVVDDWHTATLGSSATPGGWKLYLPKGKVNLALRNDMGGTNIDFLELDPVHTD